MRTREAHRHQQIFGLPAFRHQRAIRDFIRTARRNPDVAFVLHCPFGRNITLDVVRIDRVAAHAHRLRRRFLFPQFIFCHDICADHPPCLAHVDLVRPTAIVLKLVLRQTPRAHLRPHVRRHARIGRDEVKPALLIGFVLFQNLLPPLVVRLRIVVVHPDIVRRKRPVVVRVRLVIWNRVKLPEGLRPARRINAREQFILFRVVACWPDKRNPVLRYVRETHPVTIRLHLGVSLAKFPRIGRAHPGQDPALWIARHDVGTDLLFQISEVMPVMQHARLHPIVFLAVDGIRLAPDVIPHTGRSHEVSLVSGIDEHFSRVGFPAQHRDRHDPRSVLFHTLRAVEPLVANHGDFVFPHEIFEDLFRHTRLKDPHRPLHAVDRRRALPRIAILGFLLPTPRVRPIVVPPHAVIKLPRQPTDHRFVTRVGPPQSAGRQATQMLVRPNDDHALAHRLRLHRRRHARRRAAIHDDIVVRRPDPQRRCDHQYCNARSATDSR